MEASRIFGMVANQIAGDIGIEMGWKADGPEKAAIHGLIGALQAGIGGGDILAGGLAGMGSEFLAAQIGKYLAANPDLSPTQIQAIQQWAAAAGGALVGTAVAGNSSGTQTGAATALDSTKYNYLFHYELEEINNLEQKLAECKSGKAACTAEQETAMREKITALTLEDAQRDERLKIACAVPNSPACIGHYAMLSLATATLQDKPDLPWTNVRSESAGDIALREQTLAAILHSDFHTGYSYEKLIAAIENAPENTLRLILAIDEQKKGNDALAKGNYIEAIGYYTLASVQLALTATGVKPAAEGAVALTNDLMAAVKSDITSGVEQITAKMTGKTAAQAEALRVEVGLPAREKLAGPSENWKKFINAENSIQLNAASNQRIDQIISETLSRTGKAEFTSSITLTADEALLAGQKYLGLGYKEIGKPGSGVFHSADGLREFRIDNNSLMGAHSPGIPHVHFGVKDLTTNTYISNNHVPYIN